MILRTLVFIVILFSALTMPFWVTVILALLAMLYFHFFIEAIFIFLISDLVHGVKEAKLFHIVFLSFFASVLVFIGIEVLKKKLRLQEKFHDF